MKAKVFTNGGFATLTVLLMVANLVIGVVATVGCTSKGFDTCLDRGNHCNLQDLVGTCHQCICFTGIGATATTTVDYGCAAVQVGLVKPFSFCPKAHRDVYHPTKVTLADLDNIKVIDTENWFVLARLVLEQQQYGLKAVRAITATGVPISQISDGQVQVPYTATSTVCTTSTPVVISSNTTTKTSTILVVSSSSNVPQTYNISQTYDVPTSAVSSTYSSDTVQSISTPAVTESPTLSVVQLVPIYPVGLQVPQVPANGSTTPTRATTVSFVSSVTTLYLSLVPSVTTEATVPTASVVFPSYGVPTTYGVNITVTTPTLTAPATSTPTPTGGATFCSLGAEAVALVAAVGFALI